MEIFGLYMVRYVVLGNYFKQPLPNSRMIRIPNLKNNQTKKHENILK